MLHEDAIAIAEWSNGRALAVELSSTTTRAGKQNKTKYNKQKYLLTYILFYRLF